MSISMKTMKANCERTPAVVALGMFDGVHIGHQKLIQTAVSAANRLHAMPAVYTFSNHPLSILGGRPRLLTDTAARCSLLLQAGAEEVEMTVFDAALAHSTPEEFFARLMRRWRLAGLVAGYNFTFGDKAAGTSDTLSAIASAHGVEAIILPPVSADGEPVSSTRIRSLLEREGDIRRANRLLGRPYRLEGTVVANKQNGRRFGFPTANIAVSVDCVLPLVGVYATRAWVGGLQYPAVTNVGTNPTVHGDHLSVETHLIGFRDNLYGQRLAVDFSARLRGEHRFESEQALSDQITSDVECARRLLKKKT